MAGVEKLVVPEGVFAYDVMGTDVCDFVYKAKRLLLRE